MRFELTTNATLLDDALLDLLAAGRDVELHVSLDGTPAHHDHDRRVHLPLAAGATSVHAVATRLAPRLAADADLHTVVNLTIAPWHAASVADDLASLHALGFRRFNLLPAYYLAWSDAELAALDAGFRAIEKLVLASWKTPAPIELTNLDVQAMFTFFNDGLVVDTDGSTFQTNLFLWRPFDGLRARLRRGHVADEPSTWRAHPPADEVERWIAETATPTTLAATRAVDDALSSLCRRLADARARRRGRPARRPSRRAAPPA